MIQHSNTGNSKLPRAAREYLAHFRKSYSDYIFAGAVSLGIGFLTPVLAEESELPTITVSSSGEREGGLRLDNKSNTGSRLGLSSIEIPASISSLDSAAISERNLTRAQDVAIRMPGVTQSPSPGNGGTSLSARGFSGHNSVAQLVDGTRLVVASGTVTYPFSTWPLESVEVLRGPSSVLYGDGAIGAAINYVTKKPIYDRTERNAMAAVGSYGSQQFGVGLSGPINDVVAYSLYIDTDKSNGYRRDMAYDRQNISTAVALRPNKDLKVTFLLDAGHNDDAKYFGTPLINGKLDDRLRRSSFNVDDAVVNYNDKVWRAKVDYQLADNISLRNETYYLTSKRHWKNTEAYVFNTSGSVIRSSYTEILHDQDQTGNRFDLTVDGHIAGLKNRFVAGLDWYQTNLLHTNNNSAGNTTTVNPFNINNGVFISSNPTTPGRYSELETKSLFAENVLDIAQDWKLVAGLRNDHMTLDSQDLRTGVSLQKKYAPLTGRIGAVWAPTNALSLYGQYGTGTDPLSGSLSLPSGGTTFDLTKGRQLEIGAKGNLATIRGEWTVAMYKIEKRNLLTRDPENSAVTLQVGQQSSTGIEFALAAEPVRGWTIDANAALLRARYDNFTEVVAGTGVSRNGNIPTGVPERAANIWTAYRFLPQWQAGVGARYVGERQANTANTLSLPAYTVMDTSLLYSYSRNLSITLAVKNIANRDYALSGSGNTRWILGEPRTAQLIVRSTF